MGAAVVRVSHARRWIVRVVLASMAPPAAALSEGELAAAAPGSGMTREAVALRVAEWSSAGSAGPWRPVDPAANLRGANRLAFDNFDASDGCGGQPGAAYLIVHDAYSNPSTLNDMQLAVGFGQRVERMFLSWYWPGPDRNGFVAVALYDDDAVCDEPDLYRGGLVIDLGFMPGGGGMITLDLDGVASVLDMNLRLPSDGSGLYGIVLGTYVTDPLVDGMLDRTPGVQPALWGTGDAEFPLPDPCQPGTQGPLQYESLNGCPEYFNDGCPLVLGPVIGLWALGSECAYDLNGDGVVDFDDLLILLAGYGDLYSFDDLVGLLGEYGCR